MSVSGQQDEISSHFRLTPVEVETMTTGMVKLDDDSYEHFFHCYYNRLWAYATVIANGNEEDMEETLQTALEKVVRHIRVFEQEDSFWAWLATIIRNSYFDRQRKQQRRQRLQEMLTMQPLHRNAPEEITGNRNEALVQQALMQLSNSDRALIAEKYYEGASYRELADRYQTSEKAVESRLGRIRTRLRKVLGVN